MKDFGIVIDVLVLTGILLYVGFGLLINNGGLPLSDVIFLTIVITAYVALKVVFEK